VQVQDRVSIIGYPVTGEVSGQSLLVPTVTAGSITAKKQGGDELGIANGVSILQTDATVEHGNSGGPAINDRGEVVGLVSFGRTSTTNFLISVRSISDQVKQAGANNNFGTIDKTWRDGLALFDQHRYVRAKAAFDRCVALNKVQVGCADFAKQSAGLLAEDQESKYARSFNLPVVLIAGALAAMVLVGVLGVGAAALIRRRRTVPEVAAAAGPAARFCSNCGTPLDGGQPNCTRCGFASAPRAGLVQPG
jgi:hypothetical protein